MFAAAIIVSIFLSTFCNATHMQYVRVEDIQAENIELLNEALPQGWKEFCAAPVNEAVMSLYHDNNPSEAVIHVMTITNKSIALPIRSLSEIPDFDVSAKRKTLLYISAYFASDSIFSVQSHLLLLQRTRRDLNVIIVDFAKDVQQLYFAVRRHVAMQAFFVAKLLGALRAKGIAAEDITLVGHSVGANIAALGASLFTNELDNAKDAVVKIGQLIAIDPASMCEPSDVYVRRNVSERVIVVHGEGDVFGLREQRGTIDIYPNGIGYFPRRKLQPGCETQLCSHMYSFVLVMEALIERVMIPAVKCDNWAHFRAHKCDYNNTITIGLKYPAEAAGLYFCMTQPNPPFTFMEHGLKYRKMPPVPRNLS